MNLCSNYSQLERSMPADRHRRLKTITMVGGEPRRPSREAGGVARCRAWCRSPDCPLDVLNGHRTKPLISDNVGLMIAGVLMTAAVVAEWNLGVWLSKKQSSASEPR